MQHVTQKIKQILEEKNITTQELAYRLKISDQAVKKQLSRDNWTVSTLDKYADVLDVDITEFFTKRIDILTGYVVYKGQTFTLYSAKDLLLLSNFIQNDLKR